jgi:hypothetical protein
MRVGDMYSSGDLSRRPSGSSPKSQFLRQSGPRVINSRGSESGVPVMQEKMTGLQALQVGVCMCACVCACVCLGGARMGVGVGVDAIVGMGVGVGAGNFCVRV